MLQTIQAKDINLRYLVENFGIQLIEDEQFLENARKIYQKLPMQTKTF
jgi:hypothetical protein